MIAGKEIKIVRPGANGTVLDDSGKPLSPPAGWAFLAAGDAAITKKVIAKARYWRVQTTMGRRLIAKGLWAPAATIRQATQEVEELRATAGYRKRLAQSRLRRERKQGEYEQEFYLAVRAFLAFAPRHRQMEEEMAKAITTHAVPVGSGTVARTTMIPLAERAAKAVIAWMRHRTTAYDAMHIPRVKGKRREVRRMLAARSVTLLAAYRDGREPAAGCPLQKAVASLRSMGPFGADDEAAARHQGEGSPGQKGGPGTMGGPQRPGDGAGQQQGATANQVEDAEGGTAQRHG